MFSTLDRLPETDAHGEGGRNGLEVKLPDPAAAPDAANARSVLLGSIQAALQSLPPEQRDVFVAHEIEGIRVAVVAMRRPPQPPRMARPRGRLPSHRRRVSNADARPVLPLHAHPPASAWCRPGASLRSLQVL
jgi:hypothetical protein